MYTGIPQNILKSAEITADAWGHAYIFLACAGDGLAAPIVPVFFVRYSPNANHFDYPGRNVRLVAEIRA